MIYPRFCQKYCCNLVQHNAMKAWSSFTIVAYIFLCCTASMCWDYDVTDSRALELSNMADFNGGRQNSNFIVVQLRQNIRYHAKILRDSFFIRILHNHGKKQKWKFGHSGTLTKYLRGIHTHANDEIVLVQSPQNHASESHIAHLNTMTKLKVGKLHHQPIYTSTLI
jgi:hypothetical protein